MIGSRGSALLPVFGVAALLLSPAAAWACSAALPSAEGMVEGADDHVRAKALKYVRPAEARAYRRVTPAGVELEFRVAEVLKGEGVPSTLTVHGHLVEADDFNDRPVPYDFVRPGGRGGPCAAYEYKEGAEYLLFLKKKGGGLTPYWYALAPVNEQLRSADDPWLAWVKGRLTREGGRATTPTAALGAKRNLR